MTFPQGFLVPSISPSQARTRQDRRPTLLTEQIAPSSTPANERFALDGPGT
jgi:hypothetical protein